MTVADLDALAAANGVQFDSGANKADKIAALEAAGFGDEPDAPEVAPEAAPEDAPAEPESYSVRLKQDWFEEGVEAVGSFQAGDENVTLTGNDTFDTTDRQVWMGVRDIPWLEDAGA